VDIRINKNIGARVGGDWLPSLIDGHLQSDARLSAGFWLNFADR
jgi:hypothetical protein